MPKSVTDDYTRSSEKPRSTSRSTTALQVPLHFSIHKPGFHFESCCGICNLFPGVLLTAFCQVLVGSILLTLILTHGTQYDDIHKTPTTQFISIATGIVLSGIAGAGLLLIVVALTENCRAMLVYLFVAAIVWKGLMSLAVTKIVRGCVRFKDALATEHGDASAVATGGGIVNTFYTSQVSPKIKDEQHRLANLACVSGLLTFFGAILYFFSIVVVFSFYHFRYVRRAILLHEVECA